MLKFIMNFSEKVSYIKQFVGQGISVEQAYKLTYLTEEQVKELESNKELIQELKDTLIQLTLTRLDDYNSKVQISDKPSDDLKRLNNLFPEVFKTEDASGIKGDLNLIINKIKGSVDTED